MRLTLNQLLAAVTAELIEYPEGVLPRDYRDLAGKVAKKIDDLYLEEQDDAIWEDDDEEP